MGFYFRKSISFGGVRFNFSKSGIGASVGVKGFRFGTGPRGNYINIGGNGLYYRAAQGVRKNSRSTANNRTISSAERETRIDCPNDGALLFNEIESADTAHIVDTSSQDLISEINQKMSMFPFWPLALLALFIPKVGFFIAGIVALLVYLFVDKSRKTTVIFYNIDNESEKTIQKFYDYFDDMMKCHCKWHIPAQAKVNAPKYHSGASKVVKRTPIDISYKTPPYIKTNVLVPSIPVGKQTLYFFPERVLIYEGNKVGGVMYLNINIEQVNQKFIETEKVPRDSKVIDYTWQYVNKSGGQDKRFKNNYKIPVVIYSDLYFTSSTGLNEKIELSRSGTGANLSEQLELYKQNRFLEQNN